MKATHRTFTLRVDLESDRGIREGVPKLLDLLKKYNLKASFYIVMGGESNIFEILRYNKKMESSAERSIKVWSLLDKLRMVLLPKDFVKANKKILQRILDEGHELGIHGWKHREWTRGLDKIDVKTKINRAISRYNRLFGQKPISWSSPGFNINDNILDILRDAGIKYISDFSGNKPRLYNGIKNIPITTSGENRTPIIEYLISRGKSDKEILEFMRIEIMNKEIISFYIHDLFEARFKLELLEKIFRLAKDGKIENKRIIDY
ncbi:MAG: polysaccharide deacetylase family protein [Candidatus Nanoarchaeia archaeon]|nr:polysaccharide deacetylase family protein [Candidatus Nanoarchaeia archaeon]